MKNLFLILDQTDNVATALAPLEKGKIVKAVIDGSTKDIQLIDHIPMGHKFALEFIGCRTGVRKYGAPIGISTQEINVGEHVHLHNIESQRGRGDI